MSSSTRIRNRLPSLYRPDDGDQGLLVELIEAVSGCLDELNERASEVLQSHWFNSADRVLQSPHFNRGRQLRGLLQPRISDLVDLLDTVAVATKLRVPPDPVAEYLRSQLSPAAGQAVDAASPPPQLQRIIIDELNRIVAAGPLYDETRFAEVDLPDATRQLVDRAPRGSELVRLNGLLLEAAFPRQVARNVLDGPRIHDLGRLASLLTLPPWREPAAARETVEAYRLRVQRIVALYRDGLATVGALRSMVEAQLPTDPSAAASQRDRPFWIEEFAPLVKRTKAIKARGQPEDMVGPLMRWTLENDGLEPVLPTVYVQGVSPVEGQVDPTTAPLIELFEQTGQRVRVGLAYTGRVDAGQTLRLRPAHSSWLGLDDGVSRADSSPLDGASDPTAPGPWQPDAAAPATEVVQLLQTSDRVLWAAANFGGEGQLWRFNGSEWSAAVGGLMPITCLVEKDSDLLAGTGDGLARVPLYPEDGAFAAQRIAAFDGQAVGALLHTSAGRLLVGAATGAFELQADETIEPLRLQGTAVDTVAQDQAGTLYFGGSFGLIQYQVDVDRWYWYAGEHFTEQQPEWQPLADELPSDEQVFLPPVTCVHRGPDASLWIGTTRGIARYVARGRGSTYQTALEAFPDLTTGPVFDIREDARGVVWFCTDRGLLRFDGRDWWQYQSDHWQLLGRADTLYKTPAEPRGAWRFEKPANQWRRFQQRGNETADPNVALRTVAQAGVRTVAWTDSVAADRGQWDGETFTTEPTAAPVETNDFQVRVKPTETRIVGGGLPAVPRLPVGKSMWRYLSMESGARAAPTPPAWTREGRLLPPPADLAAARPGRYDLPRPPALGEFDHAVFAYCPTAKVWFQWEARRPLTVLVRLKARSADEQIDPAIIDRVWQGIQQVRPAGVRAMLAVEEKIVKGREQ